MTMQSVSISVLQLGCLITQYSYHRQFVTLQRHAAHIISISPVVTSVARGNIHLYRILVAVNCVTNNLHSSVTRAPFSGELIVASVSGSILQLSQTRDLTLTPKSPSGLVFSIASCSGIPGQDFKTRSVKFTSKITFHPTKHLIWLALRFPIVSVQSTYSVQIPLSHLSSSHASQTSVAHASCRDVNCCMVTPQPHGIM